MSCNKPLVAWKHKTQVKSNGKAIITFDQKLGNFNYEQVRLPCGKCIGCRIMKSREWAVRCVHEASLYDENCFITLTFDDEHLDEYGSLQKKDFQLFMKRLRIFNERNVWDPIKEKYVLRKKCHVPAGRIRFFHCGEYGDEMSRPHHHACLFNWSFADAYVWDTRKDVVLWRSDVLEELWPFGYSTIGEVTWQSAAYCARYVMKKHGGDLGAEHYLRESDNGEFYYLEPEYVTMSRRPGLARDYIKRNLNSVYPKDFCTIGGKEYKTPRYYDQIYDEMRPGALQEIKERRVRDGKRREEQSGCTVRGLSLKEDKLKERVSKLVRSYEYDL